MREPADVTWPMTLRSMLNHVGVGSATVVVAGIGVGSYRVFGNGVLDAGHAAYDPWSNWRSDPTSLGTVAATIFAANPHNTQPWIFHVTSDSVEVYTDPTRRTGTLDALEREQHIGLGCALENLVLAAAARGFQPVVILIPDAADATHVATVRLTAGIRVTSTLHDAIADRHSNRGPYTATAVPADVLASLGSVTAGIDGVDVRWFTSPADRTALGALLIAATETIVDDVDQSKDSYAWLRMTRDQVDTHRDGLTLDTQGLGPLILAMAKILPATSRAAGDSFWLDQTRTVHTATAAAYGMITVADPTDSTLQLVGGRLLQRIHLAATVAGLGRSKDGHRRRHRPGHHREPHPRLERQQTPTRGTRPAHHCPRHQRPRGSTHPSLGGRSRRRDPRRDHALARARRRGGLDHGRPTLGDPRRSSSPPPVSRPLRAAGIASGPSSPPTGCEASSGCSVDSSC